MALKLSDYILAWFVGFSMILFCGRILAKTEEKTSEKGDVYNFYFQKAPGPQTVQQGGGSESSEESDVSEEPSVQTGADEEESPGLIGRLRRGVGVKSMDGLKVWEVGAGVAWVDDGSGSFVGSQFSGQYNISKYLGAAAGLTYAADPSDRTFFMKSPRRTGFDAVDLQVMGIVTPIHMKIFNHNLLEMGFGFGWMTMVPRSAHWEAPRGKELLFGGAFRLGVNITDQMGLLFESRTAGEGITQSHVNWRVKF